MLKLFEAVVTASCWGGLMTLLFWSVNKLFKTKLSATWHYYIWMAVLLRLLVPVTFSLSLESELPPAANLKLPVNIERLIQSQEYPLDTQITVDSDSTPTVHRAYNPTPSPGLQLPGLSVEIAAYCWFLIAAVLLIRKIISYNLYIVGLKNHKTQLSANIPVPIIKTGDIHSPFAVGLIKPVIVLPASQYSESQLNYIFAHELNHVKRRDIAVKWLFEIAKCVHWFNPLVYLASNSADFYCDASCDEEILRNSDPEGRREYGLALLAVLSQAVTVEAPVCAAMTDNKANLKKRISRIIEPRKSGKSLLLKIAIILSVICLSACSTISYKIKEKTEAIASGMENRTSKPLIDFSLPSAFSVPEQTSFLIAGTDQDGLLTDVIIAGAFDKDTKKLSLISIPRDTRVELTEKTQRELGEQGIAPGSDVIKINSLNLYGGEKDGMKFLKSEVESLLDIKVDYYAKIDLAAFRKIVDAVGGIEMDIRPQGYYYYDPLQNLRIEVPGGRQVLDGKMAEGVIRFRSDYREGDVDRIKVQQEFMRQFIAQAMNKRAIMNNLTEFISVAISDVDTNFGVADVPKYAKYLKNLTDLDMDIQILPGEGRYVGNASYFIPEPAAVKTLAAAIWDGDKPSRDLNVAELKVQVLNGNGVPGMAAKTRDKLTDDGLNVVDIGDYDGGYEEDATRILARDKNTAKKLTPYFKNAKAFADKNIPQEYDVVIVVGRSES